MNGNNDLSGQAWFSFSIKWTTIISPKCIKYLSLQIRGHSTSSQSNIYFFHYSSKHFAFNTIILFVEKQLNWVFEWRKSVHYWWSYILFSPECKELTSMLDPLLYRWGVPPVVIRCVHWTIQMWVLQTWIKAQGLAIIMILIWQTLI